MRKGANGKGGNATSSRGVPRQRSLSVQTRSDGRENISQTMKIHNLLPKSSKRKKEKKEREKGEVRKRERTRTSRQEVGSSQAQGNER